MKTQILHVTELPAMWPSMTGFLQAACDYDPEGKVTIGGLYDDCLDGHSIAVVFWDDSDVMVGASVVTASDAKIGRYLFVRVLGGDFGSDVWLDHAHAVFSGIARASGCSDGIMLCGRPGWIRKLKNWGFREVLVTMIGGLI